MCLFCKIIDNEIPSNKVYEDDDVVAILDISQTTKAHTLVIPKKHYDNILKMPKEEFGQLMSKTHEIADNVLTKMHAEGCNILINTNAVAGQTIMHSHVHIIPRYNENDTVTISFNENKYDLAEIANQIKAEN